MKLLIALALLVACSSKTAAPDPGSASGSGPVAGRTIRIGVTLHPYFSWVSNIIKDVADFEVVPILPGEVDAGNYQPSPDDIAKIAQLDVIVINGIGHDDFIRDMIKASGNTKLEIIEVNAETPLVSYAHGEGKNSHTFISFTNAIQQTRLIANKLAARPLGSLRAGSSAKLLANAAAYGDRLRTIRDSIADQLSKARIKRVVTVHDGYTYLLQEFGIELAGVVQPSHGLIPSAKELGEMIELMKTEKVTTVFSEEDFPEKLMTTLREATGAKVYLISHIATGTYALDKFEREMTANAETLVRALVTDPSK